MEYKAGLIPFVVVDGEPIFAFMIPTNPPKGNAAPAIAKGGIEPWESESEAAIREAEEELGLDRSKLILDSFRQCNYSKIDGSRGPFMLTTFTGELKDSELRSFCDETEEVVWLTLDEFSRIGRRTQIIPVKEAAFVANLWIEVTNRSK